MFTFILHTGTIMIFGNPKGNAKNNRSSACGPDQVQGQGESESTMHPRDEGFNILTKAPDEKFFFHL